jgi:L-2-hydroxyglutarate oxidase LhgO
VAQKIEGLSQEQIPKAYFAKGNYFSLSGKSPFSHLIYPIPEPGGLGVHLTLDMGGQAKFGPDVEWLDIEEEGQINYTVDQGRGDRFYAAVRQYWPGLKDGALQADYSGVRAKIAPPNQPAGDFCFDGPEQHRLQGLFNLYGFESPGLTSSLAIAQHLEAQIKSSL